MKKKTAKRNQKRIKKSHPVGWLFFTTYIPGYLLWTCISMIMKNTTPIMTPVKIGNTTTFRTSNSKYVNQSVVTAISDNLALPILPSDLFSHFLADFLNDHEWLAIGI